MLLVSIVWFSFYVACHKVYAAPLPKKVVDLTYVFNESAHKYPMFRNFSMTVVFNGTREGIGWLQKEEYISTTHAGTHMDAPSHFIKGGANIDQIPIAQFIGPAAVIDITQKASLDPDAGVTVEDLTNWESVSGQTLDDTIILMRSGWGKKYSNRTAYIGTSGNDVTKMHFPGFSPEAAQWLVDNRKIKGVGVDTLSFDRGMSSDFMSHITLLGNGIFGLENVARVEDIPIYGAMLHVMPMKIASASGAPARIIATYTDVLFRTG